MAVRAKSGLLVGLLAAGAWILAPPEATTAQSSTEAGPASCYMGDTVDAKHAWLGGHLLPIDPLRVAYVDADQDQALDASEPLFVDTDANATADEWDVRWSDEGAGREAGQRLTPSDPEVQLALPLRSLPTLAVRFADMDGNASRSADEPMFIDADGSRSVSVGDRYLAPADVAGSRVSSGGFAGGLQFPLSNLSGRLADLDVDNDSTPNEAEPLYWDADNSSSVSVGDLCLSMVPLRPVEPSPGPTTEPSPSPSESPTESPRPTLSPSPSSPSPSSPTASPQPTAQQPGGFEQIGGEFQGAYVALTVDSTGGNITDFGVSGIAFFSHIQLVCPCTVQLLADSSGRPTGLAFAGNGASLTVQDLPTGPIGVKTEAESPVDFLVAPSAETFGEAGSVRIVAQGQEALLTRIERDPGYVPVFEVATDEAGLRVLLTGTAAFFLQSAPSQEDLFRANQAPVEEALRTGSLAAQVLMLSTGVAREPQIITYDEVAVTIEQPRDLELLIRVDANLSGGRSFLFQLPRETFDAEEVTIVYQKELAPGVLELQVLGLADGLRDALLVEPGEGAEFWVEASPDGFQIVVAVSSFSVQLFQIFGVPPESAPIFAYLMAFVFLFVAVAVMGFIFSRARRPRWRPPREQIRPVDGQAVWVRERWVFGPRGPMTSLRPDWPPPS